MAHESIIGPICLAVRAAAPALTGRAWGFQAPNVGVAGATPPTLPYAVVVPVSEVAAYHSKARHHSNELAQVSLYAADAATAADLFGAIDGALTFGALALGGDAACCRIYFRDLRRMLEPGLTAEGRQVHHWAATYRVVVERPTPNKPIVLPIP